MNVQLSEGTYIVLLHALYKTYKNNKAYNFVVAHFNHGIRNESYKDAELVKATAITYGYVYEYAEGNLGSGASENDARVARYIFLRQAKYAHKAAAILTAHHQDDMLETSCCQGYWQARLGPYARLR
jgi:tRNA(Ile)-lysidine synthase